MHSHCYSLHAFSMHYVLQYSKPCLRSCTPGFADVLARTCLLWSMTSQVASDVAEADPEKAVDSHGTAVKIPASKLTIKLWVHFMKDTILKRKVSLSIITVALAYTQRCRTA
eukprot:4434-Heterococcus_DN1.PRE.1